MEEKKRGIPWGTVAVFAWIGMGVVIGLGKRFSGARIRIGFAGVSVAAGVVFGWMVGQDQLIGWARNGVGATTSVTLLALTAVALAVPIFTGKNVYCSRICAHGAAQTLAWRAGRKRVALSAKWRAVLRVIPWLTLVAIWGLALAGSELPFADAEPFEIWSVGFHAILPAVIFGVGLVAAFFLPQAYCQYGCPTGALLKFLTYSSESFTRRDWVATVLVGLAWVYVWIG